MKVFDKNNTEYEIKLTTISSKEEYEKTMLYLGKNHFILDNTTTNSELTFLDKQDYYYVGYINGNIGFSFMFHVFTDIKGEQICYFGYYVTHSEYRGKGIVFPIFYEVYNKIFKLHKTIFLIGMERLEDKYNKSMNAFTYGRSKFYKAVKTSKNKDLISLDSKSYSDFRLITSKDFNEELLKQYYEYDRDVLGYDRSLILKKFVEIDQRREEDKEVTIILALNKDNKVVGYGHKRKTLISHHFSPISADCDEIAEAIFHYFYNSINDGDMFKVFIPYKYSDDIEYFNRKVKMFVDKYNMEQMFDNPLHATATTYTNYKKYYSMNILEH